MTRPRASERTKGPPEEREISVYHGTMFGGTIRGNTGKYVARDAQQFRIGKFTTVRKAADAISERCLESPGDG